MTLWFLGNHSASFLSAHAERERMQEKLVDWLKNRMLVFLCFVASVLVQIESPI